MEQELRFGLDLGQMADFPAFIASKSLDVTKGYETVKEHYNFLYTLGLY